MFEHGYEWRHSLLNTVGVHCTFTCLWSSWYQRRCGKWDRHEVNFCWYTSDMLPMNPGLLTKNGRDGMDEEKVIKRQEVACHHAYNVVGIEKRAGTFGGRKALLSWAVQATGYSPHDEWQPHECKANNSQLFAKWLGKSSIWLGTWVVFLHPLAVSGAILSNRKYQYLPICQQFMVGDFSFLFMFHFMPKWSG